MTGLNYVTLVCDLGDGAGNYLAPGSIATLAPTAVLTDSTDHLIAGQAAISVTFRGGPPSVTLIATDNSNISPSGWAWTITPPASTGIAAFSFYLPYAGGSVQHLSQLSPVYEAATMVAYATKGFAVAMAVAL